MGMPVDMETHRNGIQISNWSHKRKVSQARKYIFKHGASVKGVRVQNLLADQSLVPTEAHFKHDVKQTD
jgi:hypothetical protein